MYKLKVKYHFDAAHYLNSYEGKCHKTHGHRWEVEIELSSLRLASGNMMLDFSVIKDNLKRLIDGVYDHDCLNTALNEPDPTAEYLARRIYKEFNSVMASNKEFTYVKLEAVRIWESPECCAEYSN